MAPPIGLAALRVVDELALLSRLVQACRIAGCLFAGLLVAGFEYLKTLIEVSWQSAV